MNVTLPQIFPRWTQTVGDMLRQNVQVRSQCRRCGLQQRVDVEGIALKHGPNASLIGRAATCTVVGCHGEVFYLAARTHGRQWISLLERNDLLEAMTDAAPPRNARALMSGSLR